MNANNRPKLISLLAEFMAVAVFDIPRIFIESHPIYRRALHGGYKQRQVKMGLYNLKNRGMLRQVGGYYKVTARGKKWAERYRGGYFTRHHEPWDKKWRIILFDIPADKDSQRQRFRWRLKSMDAYMLQKSVFVSPYSCEDEIGSWCQEFGLSDCVDIIVADHIGSRENLAKKHFDL
jgi:phenylacetic acid degradation operon negative regulatory protein